jgi:hypothetical protein
MLGGEDGSKDWRSAIEGAPLFEALVRATVDGRERIADMGRLLEDLRRTREGRALIPDELLGLWEQVREVLWNGHDQTESA